MPPAKRKRGAAAVKPRKASSQKKFSAKRRAKGTIVRKPVKKKFAKKRSSKSRFSRVPRPLALARPTRSLPDSRIYECVFKLTTDVSAFESGRYINQEFCLSNPWNPMQQESRAQNTEHAAQGLDKIAKDGYNHCIVVGTKFIAKITPLTPGNGKVTCGWMLPNTPAKKKGATGLSYVIDMNNRNSRDQIIMQDRPGYEVPTHLQQSTLTASSAGSSTTPNTANRGYYSMRYQAGDQIGTNADNTGSPVNMMDHHVLTRTPRSILAHDQKITKPTYCVGQTSTKKLLSGGGLFGMEFQDDGGDDLKMYTGMASNMKINDLDSQGSNCKPGDVVQPDAYDQNIHKGFIFTKFFMGPSDSDQPMSTHSPKIIGTENQTVAATDTNTYSQVVPKYPATQLSAAQLAGRIPINGKEHHLKGLYRVEITIKYAVRAMDYYGNLFKYAANNVAISNFYHAGNLNVKGADNSDKLAPDNVPQGRQAANPTDMQGVKDGGD